MSFGKLAVMVVCLGGGLLACSSSSSGGGAASGDGGGGGASDAASGTDAVAEAASSGIDGGASFESINGCAATKYMDMSTGTDSDRMIMLNQAGAFDMPCMAIAAGQSVMFMWDMATYPISPGVAPSHSGDPTGSSKTPITVTSTGSIDTVKFPTAGFYPFYVAGHDSSGLLGVILVR